MWYYALPLYIMIAIHHIPNIWNFKNILSIINWTLIFSPCLYFTEYTTNIYSIIPHFIVWNILLEFYFYYAHKYMHVNKTLFNYVHGLHHEINADNLFDAQYVHPLETLFVTIPSFWLYPFLVNYLYPGSNNLYTLMLMSVLSTINSFRAHYVKNHWHNAHHQYPNTNFGTIGFIDWYYGTSHKSLETIH